jgi:signal transduction histidine kinase
MYCEPYSNLSYLVYSTEAPHLLYYSHLPAVIVSLLLGYFIISHNWSSLAGRALALIALIFSVWAIMDLFIWTQTDSRLVMFLWSYWFFFFALLFVLSFYFLYTFAKKKDLAFKWKFVLVLSLAPFLLLGSSEYNISYFDVDSCNAIEGTYLLAYAYLLSTLIFLSLIIVAIREAKRLAGTERNRVMFASIGIVLFLLSFSLATLVASIANFFQSSPDTFEIEQYGYFGMTVFIAFLTYTIVQYRAFNIRLIAAQALVVSLVVLIGSQFFFIRNPINYYLNTFALAISVIFGYLLVKSVKREIEQRERIEVLAKDLEVANTQQATLIRFITHQLKGFMSKSRNIFAMIQEGDFGPVPEPMQPLISEGFTSSTKGAQTIQEILNASNIKSGKMAYDKKAMDLAELVRSVVAVLVPNAHAKGLQLTLAGSDESLTTMGDRMQLDNALRNLIDNSIKYTPQGSVSITLDRGPQANRLTITDTGVGITPEDMANLFTEGGHGKESQKVNVDSTGFGLYIVKNIIEAHGGKVWAESDGAGKGSRFVVELPAA